MEALMAAFRLLLDVPTVLPVALLTIFQGRFPLPFLTEYGTALTPIHGSRPAPETLQ
jgi:hypothetical protein